MTDAYGGRAIGVLISGRGSNLQALIDAIAEGRLAARIALVISNRADAAGLDRARAAGLESLVLDHRGFASRDDFDRARGEDLRERARRTHDSVCQPGNLYSLTSVYVVG